MPNAAQSLWQPIVERLRAATAGELIIGDELGRGGMAAVFLAYDTHLARRVAVKVMAPELLLDEGLVERFMAEAATMANFRHSNIVTVHAVRRVDDIRFFVMQFVAGRPLDRILGHTGPLSVSMTRAIISQVGSALTYAHRRGVTHRDVKPANILVDQDGSALVTDFGIAKVVESSSRTHTGIVMGTPAYMSPEQCYGMPVSPASDQYSLGVVVFEMLTGRVPFEGTPFAAMQGHVLDPVPMPRELRPDLPEDVEHALLRMLAKSAEERWPSMRDALEALGARPLDESDPLRADLAALATLGDAPLATFQSLTPPQRSREASVVQPQSDQERTYIVLSDPPVAIAPGDEFRMSAVVYRENGTIVEDGKVAWTSSNPHIAHVDHTGVVRARAAGEVRLTAAANGLVGGVPMQIRPIAQPPDQSHRRYRAAIAATAMLVAVLVGVIVVARGREPARIETARLSIDEAPKSDSLVKLEGVRVNAVAEVDSASRRAVPTVRLDSTSARAPARPTSRELVKQPVAVAAAPAPQVAEKVAAPPITPSPTVTTSERPESVTVRVPERPNVESLRAVTSRCASAVKAKSGEQLAAFVVPDEATAVELQGLIAVIRDEGAQLRVSEPVYDAPQFGEASATEEFEVRLTWRSSFGRARNGTVRFRAGMKNTPSGWEPTACQVVRSSGLR